MPLKKVRRRTPWICTPIGQKEKKRFGITDRSRFWKKINYFYNFKLILFLIF
jgi:hypothetical protein